MSTYSRNPTHYSPAFLPSYCYGYVYDAHMAYCSCLWSIKNRKSHHRLYDTRWYHEALPTWFQKLWPIFECAMSNSVYPQPSKYVGDFAFCLLGKNWTYYGDDRERALRHRRSPLFLRSGGHRGKKNTHFFSSHCDLILFIPTADLSLPPTRRPKLILASSLLCKLLEPEMYFR